jgi:RHS repeat-associated protein
VRLPRLASRLAGLAVVTLLSILAAKRAHAQFVPLCVSGCLGVRVTPDGSSLSAIQNSTGNSAVFIVKNTGQVAATYHLTCSSTGQATCSSVTPSTLPLDPGEADDVTVKYAAGLPGSGRITLSASGGGTDTGYYLITVQAAGAPVVSLRNHNADDLDRSLCLTTGAGEAGASVCGDLVVTHSMPGYATLGRERSLTLIYNSRTAYYRPIITAAVRQPAGTATPNAVYVELEVAGAVRRTATYSTAGWGTATKQVAISYDAPGYGHATGVYPFTLRVQNQYTGAAFTTAVSGNLIVVNRFNSRFGAGVSIAGIEELVFSQPVGQPDGSILWVGGDGSAKLYTPAGTNRWVAPLGVYRDTLSLDTTTQEYTRALRHGVQVVFNQQGRHIRTVSRTSQQTIFTWNVDTLKSITVPPAATGGSYTLTYTGGALDRITDPAGRILDVLVSGGVLASIVDPDGDTTSFGYDGDRKLVSRTGRRGFTTRYEYGFSHRLTKLTNPTGRQTGDPAVAVTTFAAWDEAGLAVGATGVAVDTAGLHTSIHGPRYPGVTDTAAFWLDRWGAPIKIVNALGATTLVARTDVDHPALPTVVTYPNQRVLTMVYNGRGNLTQVLDNTSGTGNGALPLKNRAYTYSSTGAAIDSPVIVADSISGGAYRETYQYNGDGLPISVTDRRGHVTRFAYRASGTLRGVTDSVVERQVPVWRVGSGDLTDFTDSLVTTFTYDLRGNPLTIKGPTGVITSLQVDTAGRITDVYDPLGLHQQWQYDALNRITSVLRFTGKAAHPNGVDPMQSCDSTQILCADSTRSPDPSLGPSVAIGYFPGDYGIDSILDPRQNMRRWHRDARGLVTEDLDEYSRQRELYYDAAGNLTQSLARTFTQLEVPGAHRDSVAIEYDALGRRQRLTMSSGKNVTDAAVIAPDTIRYHYDLMSNLDSVSNGIGVIRRSYYGDGSLRTQTTVLPGGTDSEAYSYDAAGARTQAVRVSDGKTDVVTYSYNATTGDLQTMAVTWGAPLNQTRTFAFTWDGLGRRRQITYPVGIVVKYRYDKQGLMRRLVSTNSATAFNVNDRFDVTVRADSVDAVGRTLFQKTLCQGFQGTDGGGTGSACPAESPSATSTSNRYDRFGMLVKQASGATTRTFNYDAAGNMVTRTDPTGLHLFQIAPESNRVFSDSMPGQPRDDVKHFFYAAGGAMLGTYTNATGYFEHLYYDALGRPTGLRDGKHDLSNRTGCIKYDPDGQAAFPCDDNGSWLTFDGANVAGTLGLRWVFVSGPAVDDPLIGLYRSSTTTAKELYWLTDGQGRQMAVGMADGSLLAADRNDYLFNGGKFAGGTERGTTFDASRYEAANAPGYSFFRNRLYDQSTGRWTQEDPVGVAGGLNLYQFNGNNPVAYTDPFGLSPEDCKKVKCPSLRAIAINKTVAAAGASMLAASEKDGKERGAYLFNGPKGTIRVGEVKVGEEGQVTGMGDAPDDAIGSIHTHPTVQGANGMTFPGGPPSGGDAAIVGSENINGVVESKEARYFQPWENPRIYYTVERP